MKQGQKLKVKTFPIHLFNGTRSFLKSFFHFICYCHQTNNNNSNQNNQKNVKNYNHTQIQNETINNKKKKIHFIYPQHSSNSPFSGNTSNEEICETPSNTSYGTLI